MFICNTQNKTKVPTNLYLKTKCTHTHEKQQQQAVFGRVIDACRLFVPKLSEIRLHNNKITYLSGSK